MSQTYYSFLVCGSGVYTVLLYPLLLALLARPRMTRARSGGPPMSVSIILAVQTASNGSKTSWIVSWRSTIPNTWRN